MPSANAATTNILYGNSATFGPDLVDKYSIAGPAGTLQDTYNVSSGNGRGVVVVGNIMYTTQSGPSGNIFGGDNKIYMTDLTSHLSLGTITVAALPTGAAMSTLAWDGSQFWTSEYLGGNHAYRIDTSGTITKTISLTLASHNMDGMEYFNGKLISNRDDGSGHYDVYDLDGNVLVADFISPGGFSTGIAFDGTDFYTSDIRNGQLKRWDATGAFIENISLNAGTRNIEDLSVDYETRPDTGHTVPDTGSTFGLLSLALGGLVGFARSRKVS